MEINETLRGHLPPHLYESIAPRTKQQTILLAQQNLFSRIKLNHPEDTLTAQAFVRVVADIFQSLDERSVSSLTDTLPEYLQGALIEGSRPPTFQSHHLTWQMEHGLTTSRYRIWKYPQKGMGGAQALFNVGVKTTRTFSQDGQLQEIRFGEKGGKMPPWISPVKYYRHRKLLIDGRHPTSLDSDEAKRTVPLFTFSQTLHVLAVHVFSHQTFNMLTLSPEDYAFNRTNRVKRLESFLRAERLPLPRFCKNPDCQRIIPVGGVQDWDGENLKRRRTVYCSQACEDVTKNKTGYQQRKTRKKSPA